MNIGAMSSSMIPMQPMQSGSQQQVLSEEQKSTVNEILSSYDMDSLTQEQFEEISRQFGEAGIMPSDSLKSTIEEAGFDFSEFLATREANGPAQGGMPPPPPPQGGEESSASAEYTSQLSELLNAYESGKADQSDFENLIQSILAESDTSVGNLINTQS